MANLNPLELGRLKSLLAGKALTMQEKISTLDILRSRFPGVFSGLTEANLKDNNFLIKYLTNPYNRNKIKNALRNEKSLSVSQQTDLIDALEKSGVTAGVIYQQGQGPAEQAVPAGATGGSSGGGMPGMPSMGGMSSPSARPFRVIRVPQVEKPTPGAKIVTPQQAIRETGDPSKLVLARSDGSIITPTPKNPTIHIADKSGNIVKTYNIKSPGWWKNFSSNVGSKINIGLNKGVNKAISGINNFSLGGAGGGSRSFFGKLGRFGKGGGKSMSSLSKIGKNRGKWVFISILLSMMLLTGMLAISGTSSTGEATPLSPSSGTTSAPAVPCTSGDYKTCLSTNYKLNFQTGFTDLQIFSAYQMLSSSEAMAPKFKSLLISACPTINIVPAAGVSYVSGCTVNLKPTASSFTITHELSHIIYNSKPSYYGGIIGQARLVDAAEWEGGFLTWYSKYASRPTDFSTICYTNSTEESYLLDEEFADSIAYFINSSASEVNMGSGCQTKWSDNPYQNGNRYKGHYNLISGILK